MLQGQPVVISLLTAIVVLLVLYVASMAANFFLLCLQLLFDVVAAICGRFIDSGRE
jgi:hypothetical protein